MSVTAIIAYQFLFGREMKQSFKRTKRFLIVFNEQLRLYNEREIQVKEINNIEKTQFLISFIKKLYLKLFWICEKKHKENLIWR